MAELKEYKTTVNGLETTFQLTEEDARKRGLTGDSADAETKSRTAANKGRTATNKAAE